MSTGFVSRCSGEVVFSRKMCVCVWPLTWSEGGAVETAGVILDATISRISLIFIPTATVFWFHAPDWFEHITSIGFFRLVFTTFYVYNHKLPCIGSLRITQFADSMLFSSKHLIRQLEDHQWMLLGSSKTVGLLVFFFENDPKRLQFCLTQWRQKSVVCLPCFLCDERCKKLQKSEN